MRVFLKTAPGLESISCLEAFELVGKKFEINDGIITSDCAFMDFLKLLFYSRSAERVGLIVAELKINNLVEGEKNEKNSKEDAAYGKIREVIFYKDKTIEKILNFLRNSKSFFKTETCECFKRESKKEFRELLRKDVSNLMINKGFLQNLKKPDFYFFLFKIKNVVLLGIDFGEVHRRKYSVFNNPQSIRHNIIYSALRIAGFSTNFKGTIIDLTSKSDFLIEAILYYSNSKNEVKNINNRLISDLGKEIVGKDFEHFCKEEKEDKKDEDKEDKYSASKNKKTNFVAYSKYRQNLSVLRKNSLVANVKEILFTEEHEKVAEFLSSSEKNIVIAQVKNYKELNELKGFFELLKNSILIIISNNELNLNILKTERTKYEKQKIFQGLNSLFLHKICFD